MNDTVKLTGPLRQVSNGWHNLLALFEIQASEVCLGELFADDKRNVLDVIKWKEIYETMETATDRGEDVANLLEEIVLKRS